MGAKSGLFTPQGFAVLYTMYFLLFLLYESLANKYRLTYGQLALLNFALYSVLITGLFHREIADYVLHPHNDLITTLIRVQCSFFPLFVYALLNRWGTRDVRHVASLRAILLAWVVFVLILGLTHKFGLPGGAYTFQVAPIAATVFTCLGLLATLLALRPNASARTFSDRRLVGFSIALAIVGAIPSVAGLLVLVVAMPSIAVAYLLRPAFRRSTI